MTDEQIAKNMGINICTYYDWRKKFPAIEQKLQSGRAPLEVELENALIKKALGYVEETPEIVEEVTDKNGVVTRHKKSIKRVYPPDTGALIFLLKNWMKEDYQERPKLAIEREQLSLQNEHQRLQNELMKKMLQDSDSGMDMVKRLLEDIDEEVVEEIIEEAEEVVEE